MKQQYNNKKQSLIEISKVVKPLVDTGVFGSVNEAVIDTYKDEENKVFKTFHIWKSEGYKVKKRIKRFSCLVCTKKSKKNR